MPFQTFLRVAHLSWIGALVLLGACARVGATATSTPRAVVETSASEQRTTEEFERRVQEYRALVRKLEVGIPTLPKRATPEQIDEYRRTFGARVRNARAGAKRGEIFTAEMEALVKKTMRAIFSGSDGKTMKASIMDENPGVPALSVNDRYPDALPLSTMPPQVLAALPKLEEELEYRFIGERLVLMDPRADIVVDFTADVLP